METRIGKLDKKKVYFGRGIKVGVKVRIYSKPH